MNCVNVSSLCDEKKGAFSCAAFLRRILSVGFYRNDRKFYNNKVLITNGISETFSLLNLYFMD